MRQIVLDTETTGLETAQGHRIIEIGCVEVINRRITKSYFHHYLQPDRKIDAGAGAVHGITDKFLRDKPRFADIVDDFMQFIKGAELIIHNADFDVGFINHELTLLKQNWQSLTHYCRILDTLLLARERHPGQKNNLDALCKRYDIDNTKRQLHGALLDAEILAEVYLAMTGGQINLLATEETNDVTQVSAIQRISAQRPPLAILMPVEEEQQAHEHYLDNIDKASNGQCLWRKMAS